MRAYLARVREADFFIEAEASAWIEGKLVEARQQDRHLGVHDFHTWLTVCPSPLPDARFLPSLMDAKCQQNLLWGSIYFQAGFLRVFFRNFSYSVGQVPRSRLIFSLRILTLVFENRGQPLFRHRPCKQLRGILPKFVSRIFR